MDCYRKVCVVLLILGCAAFCRGELSLTVSSTDVEEHAQVIFTCNLPARNAGATFQKGATEINADEERVRTGLTSSTQATLTITRVEHEDAGTYTCKPIGGQQPSNGQTITVSHHKHPVKAVSSTVRVSLGSNLKLSCTADIHTGVLWFKGDDRLEHYKGDVRISVTSDETSHLKTSVLTINNGESHEGKYKCKNDHEDSHTHSHSEEESHEHEHDEAVITVTSGSGEATARLSLFSVAACLLFVGYAIAA